MAWGWYVILYLGSLILGGAGAWIISRLGDMLGIVDEANHRSSHDGVVPKGGGIGILTAFVFSAWRLGLPFLFWISVTLISVFSFYGDRKELPPKVRLLIQFLGSLGLLIGLFYWQERAWAAYLFIPFFALFITGTANYYNFMDGINGIAGITGIIAFGLITLFGFMSGSKASLVILSSCMGVACLGFLPFNMPKARVFMGDVGSVLLGFVYAALAVALSHSLNDFLVLCSFLFPFYADELTTAYVRLRDGENLMKPHRRHIYQLLANEMGIEHWKVSAGYGLLQALVGLGALIVREFGALMVVGYLGVWFVGFWIFGGWVRRRAESPRPVEI